ncbi:NUDIX domain-containing protein [Microbispora sp. RL4-1S]|uniref:NUDIX domain-containing protein n=1 Tax=Microbispora oryzae TaxID=2806554 RepID=A0A941AKI4_9ACTN|nr:NUDIX domain-containing protein [Microbispora oryzae]MBP2707231.1 NUDIX domain-containing protein [Microbispora oryzae]
MGIPLPGHLADRARAMAAGEIVAVPARDAATVVLLRDDPLEVYLLERAATMAFAAGVHVFPGGSVDPRDADHAVAWAGPPAAEWAEIFHVDERTARGLVCAAVRETFEESGVLLAGADDGTVVGDTTGDDWEADRLALVGGTLSLAGFLAGRGLVLRSDLLRPWAHWITPAVETRRFDTRFFVAALPPGQRTRDVGGEAAGVAWMRPADALAGAAAGQLGLMAPTLNTLTEIGAFERIDEVFAAERTIMTVLPAAVEVDGRMVLTVPGLDYRSAVRGGSGRSAGGDVTNDPVRGIR